MKHRKRRPQKTSGAETKDPTEQYQQRFTSIAQLDARDFRYSIDPYGRLHTVLARLSTPLRRFVFIEGHAPLVAIDLRCSQPFLVNILLNKAFTEKPWKKGRRGAHPPITIWQEGRSLAEEVTEEEQAEKAKQASSPALTAGRQPQPKQPKRPQARQGQQGRGGHLTPSPTAYYVMRCRQVLGINSVGFAQFRPDVEEYRQLTSSGQFYEQMQRRLGLALGQAEVSRDTVKTMLFEAMFSHNCAESKTKAAFTELFPTVDAVLRTLKRKRYQYLATLLQTIEATIFIRRLVPLIRRRFDIPVFTVHDSVIVPAPYADRVETLMREHITRWVGVAPQFKREAWGGEELPEASPAD